MVELSLVFIKYFLFFLSPCADHYIASEPEPFIMAYLHHEPEPNEYNCTASKKISLEALSGDDHKLYTFFTSPL